jgi:uncharacterized protein
MRVVIFLLIVLTVVFGGFGYIGARLAAPYAPGSGRRRATWVGIGALALVVLGGFAIRFSGAAQPTRDAVSLVAYTALGFASLLLTFVVMRDLGWLAYRGARRLRRRPKPDPDSVDEGRRNVLLSSLNAGKIGASSLLAGYGFGSARDRPAIAEVRVPLRGLPPSLEGFRIAQITDLHVGPTIKRDYVAAVVEAINELDVDLVAITGDLVDGSVPQLEDDVDPLAALRSRHGTFFVTGNHEYYSGAEAWVAHLRELGMTVLMNEHRVIEHAPIGQDGIDHAAGTGRLLVAGVTDFKARSVEPGHTSDPHKAIAGAPEVEAKLLLAHQPRSVHEARAAGFDLQLSGHTHGGQFFPWNLVVHLVQPYVAGLHDHDGTLIYVSRGTGYWGPPLRLGAPSEITLLELHSA